MSSFEKQLEAPLKPETSPEVDIRLALEQGEIIDNRPLNGGYYEFRVVEIKDDGKGLFRPEEPETRRRPLRVQLELLAKLIDDVLRLNLVPEIVARTIGSNEGTLQCFLAEAKPLDFSGNWRDLISEEELIRAALFDYLIKAADNRTPNSLLDENGKIWLIDNDDLMYGDTRRMGYPCESIFIAEAKNRALTGIPEKLRGLLKNLIERLDQLLNDPKELRVEKLAAQRQNLLSSLITSIRKRATLVLETGIIST